ncbi:hypothetical protein FACS1894172_12200 [Spirochaetia bacterium]|nr:hypothetical protein FACS1894172_12200 [Spirochaetia bacterium]
MGVLYAKATYLYPLFETQQSRFFPVENSFSQLLYRTPLKKVSTGTQWYYETTLVAGYRQHLERKFPAMTDSGIRILTPINNMSREKNSARSIQKKKPDGINILHGYRKFLERFPDITGPLTISEQHILETLLPTAAAIQRDDVRLHGQALIEKTRHYCIEKIDHLQIE